MVAGHRFLGRKPGSAAETATPGLPVDQRGDDGAGAVLWRTPVRRGVLAGSAVGVREPIAGDVGFPPWGSAWRYARGGPAELLARYRADGPVWLYAVRGERRVVIAGPEALEQVLSTRRADFDTDFAVRGQRMLRRGIGLLEGEEHRFHRAILEQALAPERVDRMLEALVPIVEQSVGQWVSRQPQVRLVSVLRDLSSEIVFAGFIGAEPGAGRGRVAGALRDCATLRDASPLLSSNERGRRLRARRLLEDYLAQLLPGKRAGVTPDLFSALCHARSAEQGVLGRADVLAHLIFLLASACATLPAAATAVAYHLGRYPHWQQRVRSEVEVATTMPELRWLPALDAVCRESLRLLPPVPAVARRVLRDTEIMGRHIPAGTGVDLAYQVGHLLPEIWVRPHAFDPDRFTTPESASARFAYLPFGAGVHRCLAAGFALDQVKLMIAALVRACSWDIAPGYLIPATFPVRPRSARGVPVTLHRRRA